MRRREFLRDLGVLSLTVVSGQLYAGRPSDFGAGPIPRYREPGDPGEGWHAVELPYMSGKAVWVEEDEPMPEIEIDSIRLWMPRGERLSEAVIQVVKEELSKGEIKSEIERVAQEHILRQTREVLEGSCSHQDSDSGAAPEGGGSPGDESTGSPIGILRALSDEQDGPHSA